MVNIFNDLINLIWFGNLESGNAPDVVRLFVLVFVLWKILIIVEWVVLAVPRTITISMKEFANRIGKDK